MDARRKVLLTDLAVGLASVANGLFFGSAAAVDLWWVGGLVAVGGGGLAWATEHGVLGERATILLVAAFGLAMLGLGVSGLAELAETGVIPVTLVGIGVGIVAYRVYYGVVRPVPASRLEGARRRGV